MITPIKACLTESEAALYIGMSRSYLRKARIGIFDNHPNQPPKFIRVAKRGIRYLRDDLDRWLADHPKAETLAAMSVLELKA